MISIALIHRLLSRRLALLTLDAWGTGALAGLTRDTSVDPFLCFNRSNAALRVQDVLNGIAVLSAGVGPHAQDAPGTGAWSKVTDGVGLNAPGTPGTGAWSKVTDGVGLNAPNAPETGAWSDGRLGAASRILPVHLLGLGQAGLWCLLARALCGAQVARTVVDAAQFACDDDQAWLDALYLPHIRRAGDLHTAAALTVPGALCVHNAAPSFPSEFARQAYRAAGAFDALHIQAEPADTETITDWLMEPFQAKR